MTHRTNPAYDARSYDRLQMAGKRLYLAGKWTSPDLADDKASLMWMEFRDALGLQPGTATREGVGG